MFSAHHLIIVYVCTKFHEHILNGIRVTERTRTDRVRIDGRTDGGHDKYDPSSTGISQVIWMDGHMIRRTDRPKPICPSPKLGHNKYPDLPAHY